MATRNINSQPSLPHPNETHTVTQLLGPGTKLHHSMRQQLSSYATGLRTLHPAARLNLTEPDVGGLPVVVALARLAQLEDDIRTAEINALGHVSSQISNSRLKQRLVAFASAESNQVAPGNLYKARLYLTTALGPLPGVIQMRCNGQPVPVDSNSMGHVRFVAPNQLGPTTWTGTIGFQVGGRDTLFRVRVPYRVARP